MKFIVILAGKKSEIEVAVLEAQDAVYAAWLVTDGRDLRAIALTPNEARVLTKTLINALEDLNAEER